MSLDWLINLKPLRDPVGSQIKPRQAENFPVFLKSGMFQPQPPNWRWFTFLSGSLPWRRGWVVISSHWSLAEQSFLPRGSPCLYSYLILSKHGAVSGNHQVGPGSFNSGIQRVLVASINSAPSQLPKKLAGIPQASAAMVEVGIEWTAGIQGLEKGHVEKMPNKGFGETINLAKLTWVWSPELMFTSNPAWLVPCHSSPVESEMSCSPGLSGKLIGLLDLPTWWTLGL